MVEVIAQKGTGTEVITKSNELRKQQKISNNQILTTNFLLKCLPQEINYNKFSRLKMSLNKSKENKFYV